jgi:hypothetical protein
MPTPTVDFETVLTLARQLPTADQTRLAALLVAAEDAAPAHAGTIANDARALDVQHLLAHTTLNDLIVPPHGTTEDARALLQAWREEDANDEEGEPWDEVLRSLDANRFSTRRLFEELDGT